MTHPTTFDTRPRYTADTGGSVNHRLKGGFKEHEEGDDGSGGVEPASKEEEGRKTRMTKAAT